MYDYSRDSSYGCTSSSCGDYAITIVYYIIFVLMQQYIMLNLFILVLMQNFEENYINTDNPIQNFSNNAEDFKVEWMNFCNKNQILYIN